MKTFHKNALALAIGVALSGLPALSPAATDPNLQALREEIAQMKQAYEQRINTLEKRLAQAEASVAGASRAAPAAAPSPLASASPATSSSAFNPSMSLILSGMYANLKENPDKTPYRITGFAPSMGEVAPPARGFSLGESELVLEANIDHLWRGRLNLALPPEEGEPPAVEEAFIQTAALGHGFGIKAGRMLSGIGYMNEQHAHAWDFSDAPLAYKAFFGNQLRADGVQLKWLAPTDIFFELGIEAANGGNFPSTERGKNGSSMGSLFAHVGGDINVSSAWRAGLSLVAASPRDREYAEADALGADASRFFSGKSRTLIADAVWKWAPQGNANNAYFKLQGEYFRRRENGTLAYDDTGGSNVFGAGSDGYGSRQSGFYLQGVVKFAPQWRVGYRYDRLDYGSLNIGLVNGAIAGSAGGTLTAADFGLLAPNDPRRNTVMLDWSPSEFSRVRLQYARDQSQSGVTDNQMWLHYIVSLGAHGAHSF